jgi:hypothetical protein
MISQGNWNRVNWIRGKQFGAIWIRGKRIGFEGMRIGFEEMRIGFEECELDSRKAIWIRGMRIGFEESELDSRECELDSRNANWIRGMRIGFEGMRFGANWIRGNGDSDSALLPVHLGLQGCTTWQMYLEGSDTHESRCDAVRGGGESERDELPLLPLKKDVMDPTEPLLFLPCAGRSFDSLSLSFSFSLSLSFVRLDSLMEFVSPLAEDLDRSFVNAVTTHYYIHFHFHRHLAA